MGETRKRMSPLRRFIANKLRLSVTEIPQISSFYQVDVTELVGCVDVSDTRDFCFINRKDIEILSHSTEHTIEEANNEVDRYINSEEFEFEVDRSWFIDNDASDKDEGDESEGDSEGNTEDESEGESEGEGDQDSNEDKEGDGDSESDSEPKEPKEGDGKPKEAV